MNSRVLLESAVLMMVNVYTAAALCGWSAWLADKLRAVDLLKRAV